jgi:hypothetical protein
MPSYGASANAHDYVKVSTDGGTNWDIIGDLCVDPEFEFPGATGGPAGAGWQWFEFPIIIDLSDYDNEASVMVAWNYQYDGVPAAGIWSVDDVLLEGDYSPPGGCDFDVEIIDPEDGAHINSNSKLITVRVENKGPVPINEVKKLLDIYEMIPGATSEVCFDDFEGALTCWATVDNGDADTFTISDTRAYSGNYSYRCTAGIDRPDATQDTYLGHAAHSGPDELIMTCPQNLDGAAYGTVSFMHWAQGEYYIHVSGAAMPTDYGTVAVSNDGGGSWYELPHADFVAYDNGWQQFTIAFDPLGIFPGTADVVIPMALTDQMVIKFMWHSDPHMEYEGWYIDDVGFTRTEPPTWKLVFQGHSIQSLDGYEVKEETFPLPWDDLIECHWYMICVAGQVFDPADCESNFANNEDCILVHILDECDVGVIDMEGPDILEQCTIGQYTATVKNFGTFPETNIPVDLKICRLEEATLFEDDFEGASQWNSYYFVGDYIPDWFFHISTWDSNSGSRALACFDPSAAGYPNLLDKMGQLALIADDGDAAVFDFNNPDTQYGRMSFYAKYSFRPGDGWSIAIGDPDEGWLFMCVDSLYGYNMFGFDNEFHGMPTNPGGYPEYYDVDLISLMDQVRAANPGMFDDGTGRPDYRCQIGFAVFTNDDGCVFNTDNPQQWSGLMVDDVRVYHGYCGDVCDTVDTAYVPFLDIGEETTVEFEWHGEQFCTWCVCAETDYYCDENPDNDRACTVTKVMSTFDDMPTDEAGEAPWDHVDHTDVGGSLWHIVSKQNNTFDPEPPTDQYFWCGIDDWGIYPPNLDDSLISEVFDLSGVGPGDKATVEIDTYYDFGEGDCGEVWFSNDAGTHWYLLGTVAGPDQPPYEDWHKAGFIIEGDQCTDEMQIKFRMISDGYEERNGWYIDDIKVAPLTYEGEIYCKDSAMQLYRSHLQVGLRLII